MIPHQRARVQWQKAVPNAYAVTSCAATDKLVVCDGSRGSAMALRAADGELTQMLATLSAPCGVAFPSCAVDDEAGVAYLLGTNGREGCIDVRRIYDGALLRTICISPRRTSPALALDAKRDLLYVVVPTIAHILVYRASDGTHRGTIWLPLKNVREVRAAVVGATGAIVVTALRPLDSTTATIDVLTGVLTGPWHNVSADLGMMSFARLVTTVPLHCPMMLLNIGAAVSTDGELIYIAHYHYNRDGNDDGELNFCVSVVRLSDGRMLGVLSGLRETTSLCATPTALVACHYYDDMVVSLHLPARLRWQPDADVHPLFDEDDSADGGFCRAVSAVLALATCMPSRSSARRAMQQQQRLPLELLCTVFRLMAPAVLQAGDDDDE